MPVLLGVPLLVIDNRARSKRWRYFNRENLNGDVGLIVGGSDVALGANSIDEMGPEDLYVVWKMDPIRSIDASIDPRKDPRKISRKDTRKDPKDP